MRKIITTYNTPKEISVKDVFKLPTVNTSVELTMSAGDCYYISNRAVSLIRANYGTSIISLIVHMEGTILLDASFGGGSIEDLDFISGFAINEDYSGGVPYLEFDISQALYGTAICIRKNATGDLIIGQVNYEY